MKRRGQEGPLGMTPIATFISECYDRVVVVVQEGITLRIVPVIFEKPCNLGSNLT